MDTIPRRAIKRFLKLEEILREENFREIETLKERIEILEKNLIEERKKLLLKIDNKIKESIAENHAIEDLRQEGKIS